MWRNKKKVKDEPSASQQSETNKEIKRDRGMREKKHTEDTVRYPYNETKVGGNRELVALHHISGGGSINTTQCMNPDDQSGVSKIQSKHTVKKGKNREEKKEERMNERK